MKYLLYIPIVCLSFGVAFGGVGLMQATEGSEALLAEADSSAGKVGGWYHDCTEPDECPDPAT